jgi:DNA-binding MarR family transcriptional regulator
VSRHRPENDRRSIFIFQTPAGRTAMINARHRHREWIKDNFVELLSDADIKALTRAFEKLSAHARMHRPGRVSG